MTQAALILAGGGGTRLGGVDKGLLTWRGEPFVVHLARLLSRVGPVAVVTQVRQSAYQLPLRQSGVAVEFVHDPWVDEGPMAGLVAGLEWARTRGRSGAFVVPCDSPCLTEAWLSRVVAAAEKDFRHLYVCESEGRLQPLHGWFPVALELPLQDALRSGERRVGRWVESQKPVVIPCSDLAEQFLNVNTMIERTQLDP